MQHPRPPRVKEENAVANVSETPKGRCVCHISDFMDLKSWGLFCLVCKVIPFWVNYVSSQEPLVAFFWFIWLTVFGSDIGLGLGFGFAFSGIV